MIISIHQPNFIPWIGYFNKIIRSDIFVLIDQVQFKKGSVCNRNKIKSKSGNELLFTVPVKISKGSYQTFNEIEIDYSQNWQAKFLNLLKEHYRKGIYFEEYYEVISTTILKKYPNLSELNINLIKTICDRLNISTSLYVASELPYDFGKKNEMNLAIVKYFHGDIYLSGQGAKIYNDADLFKNNNITLEYLEFTHPVYPQVWGKFIPNLSIIDLLINCGPMSKIYIE